mmetsp:Transcript_88247/g.248423  ORF Transcript_88247/g.248423 Transcript_88247/m.248423 type:complete len:950 (-) Transcript_88247:100-2949(-)
MVAMPFATQHADLEGTCNVGTPSGTQQGAHPHFGYCQGTSPPPPPGTSAAALADVGMRLKAAGDWRGAAEKYYEALRMDPGLYAAQYNLGALYLLVGDLQRALEHTERAYNVEPRSADAMHNLGEICRAQGLFETAVQWYRAALRFNPNCETTHSNLCVALISLGLQVKPQDPKGAIKCYQEALVHSPTSASAYYNLGVSYAELRKHTKALVNYNLAVHFNPRCAEAYNNMGVIYKEQDNIEKALKCYHAALQCNPRFAQTLNNLGVTYTSTGRLMEALEYLSRAVAVAPTYAEAYNNLGWLFWDHGDMAQALRMYERCMQLSPTSKNPSQNRLLALNYLSDVQPAMVYEAHKAWGERFCHELGTPFTDWLVRRTTKRRIKIGYISPDFFHHSVSFFAHALLEHRNRELFEVVLYSNTAREDDKTEFFKTIVPEGCFKKVLGQSAHEVANMIREDKIDILIELAGHTANNRLDVVALKPAPVQITYIGYNNTTGLGAVDYRITDEVVDPINTEQPFSEELVRLPGCFLCYTPLAKVPDVEQLPALREGFITFGSFSCLAKIGPLCVALWARVLREVPGSRLLVKNKGFYSNDVQAQFISQFKAHGIAENRLKLLSLAPAAFDHLKIYNDVDIALDTFPYSNTTTTCETLLMGVPVICLCGTTHGSRVGVTLLNAVGLSDFVAMSQDEYVQKAKSIASDLRTLSLLRQNLRQALFSSPLCDGPGFVRDKYEPVLLEKWRLFCEGRAPSVQVFSSHEPPDPLAPGPFAPPLPPGTPFVSPAAMAAAHGSGQSSGQPVQFVQPIVSLPLATHVPPTPTCNSGAPTEGVLTPGMQTQVHQSSTSTPQLSAVAAARGGNGAISSGPGAVAVANSVKMGAQGSGSGESKGTSAATAVGHPSTSSPYTRSFAQGIGGACGGGVNHWQRSACGSARDIPGISPGRRRPRTQVPRICA